MSKSKACVSLCLGFLTTLFFFSCEIQEDFKVHTIEVTDITAHTATVEVEIRGGDDADILSRGVVWGTSPEPTRVSPHGPRQTDEETLARIFSSHIAWLSPETFYYARGYVLTARETIYGEDISFTTPASVIDYGSVTDVEGNQYKTVTIGNQEWMAENLKVTRYADGTSIPYVADDAGWADLGRDDKAYTINQVDPEGVFGAYYTWTAATRGENSDANPSNVQGVCPAGWHLPSNAQWRELDDFIGHDQGITLKATFGWAENGSGLDVFGFAAFPAGFRNNNTGEFSQIPVRADFWGSDLRQTRDVHYAQLSALSDFLYRGHTHKNHGMSVRCVRPK